MSKIVAHRGQNTTHPENTLDSIKKAVDCGAKAVEFDVQMSTDHIPLVCHDINLQRKFTQSKVSVLLYTPQHLQGPYSVLKFHETRQVLLPWKIFGQAPSPYGR